MAMIPTQKNKPKTAFTDELTLIYGAPKVGKSTFCSQLESPLFLDTEGGLNNLEVYKVDIDSWDAFKDLYKELRAQKGKLPFKTLVIDTIDNLYQFCSEYICEKNDIVHESDLAYGKGWSMVRKEFNVAMSAYRMLGLGVIYTSHAQAVEITTRTGKYNRYEPTMTKQCKDVIEPTLDFELYAEIIAAADGSERRVIHTKPCQYWAAGDRTGKLPAEIELDAKTFINEFNKIKEAK